MSEEQVYNFVKNNRELTTPVGRFTSEELDDIVEDPPIVDFKNYIQLRGMSLKQLLRFEPALVIIVPNISKDDAFFYLTRGYIRENPYLRDKVNDFYKFDNFDQVTQDLLVKLYGSKIEFINRKVKNKLENAIFEYDKVMNNDIAILDLAQKYNLDLSEYEDLDQGFVNEILKKNY